MWLGNDQFKVKVEDEKHIYIIPDKHCYHDLISIAMVLWDRVEYKVVPINKIIFMTWGKGQTLRWKAHHIIPAKHSYHYLSSIVMVLRDNPGYPSMAYCCKNLCFVILGKGQFKVNVKIKGEKCIYIITAKHQYRSSIIIGLWDILNTKWYPSMV